jgi:hypothetical protein
VFPEGVSIGIGELSKADGCPQCEWTPFEGLNKVEFIDRLENGPIPAFSALGSQPSEPNCNWYSKHFLTFAFQQQHWLFLGL